MNMYSTTTSKQQAAIVDFIETARTNGICNLWACLPKTHTLVKTNRVHQIRKVKDSIAEGWDELDHRVRLTPDLRIIQD
jgi:hypothetical protein